MAKGGSPSVQAKPKEKTEAEVKAEVAAKESQQRETEARRLQKKRGRQSTYGISGPAATLVNFDQSKRSAKL